MNGSRNVFGGIENHLILHIFRLPFGKLFEFGLDRLHGVQSVGIRSPVNAHPNRRLTVDDRVGAVAFAPELHPRDISDSHQAALIVATYDDVFKIINLIESSLGKQGVQKLLVASGW